MEVWPASAEALVRRQLALGRVASPPWRPEGPLSVGGCFVCFRHLGAGVDRAWAAAALVGHGPTAGMALASGEVRPPYEPGLLALREGPLLEAAVRALSEPPDVLIVNATGRDHPRRAGLALHLGAVLELPTAGVTHRPLVAAGPSPGEEQGARSPLLLDGEVVGYWLRTRRGARPLAVHAAWRTDPETAAEVVLAATVAWRTPEPLRRARELARRARALVRPLVTLDPKRPPGGGRTCGRFAAVDLDSLPGGRAGAGRGLSKG